LRRYKEKIIQWIKYCTAMIGCPRYVFHNEAYKKFKHLDWINAGEAGIENLNLFKLDFNADRLDFENNLFDYVVAMTVLSLLGDEARAKLLLSEFKRVM